MCTIIIFRPLTTVNNLHLAGTNKTSKLIDELTGHSSTNDQISENVEDLAIQNDRFFLKNNKVAKSYISDEERWPIMSDAHILSLISRSLS